MAKWKAPITPAVRWLRQQGARFTDHLYVYEEHGGASASARALGVAEHAVIKTLILEDDTGAPLAVLMHGDREVATGLLARELGRRSIAPCRPEAAQRHTGYRVGGTSPFGMQRAMPVCAEAGIRELDSIWINGGKRGYLVGMTGAELWRLLRPIEVHAAAPPPR